MNWLIDYFQTVADFAIAQWWVIATLVFGALSIGLMLPRPRKRMVLLGSVLGVAALVIGGSASLHIDGKAGPETFLFYTFSTLAIVGGAMMIVQRNPARAALCFTLVVMNTCGLFLLNAAPFLMAATIIIYAGAIIVTFLFVLMLSQPTGFSDADDRSREPFIASTTAFLMLGGLLIMLGQTFPAPRKFNELVDRISTAAAEDTIPHIRTAIGDKDAFLAELQREEKRHRGSANNARWKEATEDLQEQLSNESATAVGLKADLTKLADAGRDIQNENRRSALPAENVAALGRLLFSDHLLAIELGGTLLLVATIGAIAIAHRRGEKST